MSKSTRGIRVAGIASLAVSLSVGVAAPAFAVPSFEFKRIGGADRYETAALVADEYGAKPDAILANGQPGFYADALASNYLSKVKDAPILLTRIKELPQSTLDQLDQMNAQRVTVVGGESVVPQEQVDQLTAAGYTVTRISGDDRFGTNAEVIGEGGAATGGIGLIATGFNFPDALAAGPFAYQGHPLGLSTTNDVKDEVLDALEADGVKEVLIFGGTDAVGPGVVSDLAARGITVKQRFAGADRSETSELAAEWALANLSFTNKHVGVASGYTEGYGADALAGGPLEGKEKSPMLITRNVDNPDDVIDYLTKHSDTLETGHLFGGTAAISAAAEAAMEKAAQGTAATGRTERPELVSARVVDTNTSSEAGADGTTVEYTFDENIVTATGGTAPAAGKFNVYNTDSNAPTPGDFVTAASGTKVTVRFNGILTDSAAAALTLATVDFGAVNDTGGARTENPEGDAPLNTSTGDTPTSLPAGITEAPDLTGVGSFTSVTPGADADADTDVVFTFDEAATATAFANFSLVRTNGTVITADSIRGGSGTQNIVVRFSENVAAADVARGVVAEDTATEATDNESDTADKNELQAADVSQAGNSDFPDLVSVELREDDTATGDKALFTFDEPISAVPTPASLRLYYAEADPTLPAEGSAPVINVGGDARQVLVTYAENAINGAVGGQALAGAVTGTDLNPNRDDEVGVANTTTTTGKTAGKIAGPDLTGVKVAVRSDGFGGVEGVNATYTFDEAVTGDPVEGDFQLYLANGTLLDPPSSCTIPNNGTASNTKDDTSVVCQFTGPLGDRDQALDAVLGTVDDDAVDAEDATAPTNNPEGAEPVTK